MSSRNQGVFQGTWKGALDGWAMMPRWLFIGLQVLSGAALLAVMAQIKIFLPGSPVPVTGQTMAVLVLGTWWGFPQAPLAVGAYLAIGSLGFSDFALNSLRGVTGGYLVGFLSAAMMMSWAFRRWPTLKEHFFSFVGILLLAEALMLGLGVGWLAQFVGIRDAVAVGALPFLLGEAAKLVFVVTLWKSLRIIQPGLVKV